jgi:hypothetical protein
MIREKLWYEIADTKYGELYLAFYISRCRNYKKTFKILTLIFSAGGVFGWKIWEPFAVVACVIIAVIQLLSLIENQIVRSDDDLIKIGELRNLYISYLNKLEKLWVDFENQKFNEDETAESFFKLKEKIKSVIESKDNELEINGGIERLLKKCDATLETYLNKRYGKAN